MRRGRPDANAAPTLGLRVRDAYERADPVHSDRWHGSCSLIGMVESEPNPPFLRFATRVVACHVVTYLVCGLVFSNLLDYASRWQDPLFAFMRPLDSPWVALGPALQVVRGLVLAIALYPFRGVFLREDKGAVWLAMLLIGIGVLSTYGPAPGSLEGLVYTRLPLAMHLFGLPEVLIQAAAFCVVLVAWNRRPHRAWAIVFGILTALTVLMSLAGVFLAPPA
jgi:hypothetical protein